jgi:hypothetical protein
LAVVDIDVLWAEVKNNVKGLQSAGRLPGDGELYDPRLEVIKQYLEDGYDYAAEQEAKRLARSHKGAGFMAYELLKVYRIAEGNTGTASAAAVEAAKLLKDAEREVQKKRKSRW